MSRAKVYWRSLIFEKVPNISQKKQNPGKVLNINSDNLGFSAAVRSASLSHNGSVFLIGGMPRLPFPLPLFWESLNQTATFPTSEKDEKCQTDRRKDNSVRLWDVFHRPSAGFLFSICQLEGLCTFTPNAVLRHFSCTCTGTCTCTCNKTQCVQQKWKCISLFPFIAKLVGTIQNNWHQ